MNISERQLQYNKLNHFQKKRKNQTLWDILVYSLKKYVGEKIMFLSVLSYIYPHFLISIHYNT